MEKEEIDNLQKTNWDSAILKKVSVSKLTVMIKTLASESSVERTLTLQRD